MAKESTERNESEKCSHKNKIQIIYTVYDDKVPEELPLDAPPGRYYVCADCGAFLGPAGN